MLIAPLTIDECAQAAHFHQTTFYRGWTEKEFQDLLKDPLVCGFKAQEKKSFSKLSTTSQNYHAEFVLASQGAPKQVRDNNMCGYILCRIVKNEAEILTLVIAQPFQRKGIGSLLLQYLYEHLKAKGVSKLFLEVAEDDKGAQSFYVTNGFALLGQRPKYYKRPGNQFVDALNFVKVIE